MVNTGQATEAVLRQRANTLLSPEAVRVLELHYDAQYGVLVIGCLGVSCWLQLAPEHSGLWAFVCPWWRTLIAEGGDFEAGVLAEVGRAKMQVDSLQQNPDQAKAN